MSTLSIFRKFRAVFLPTIFASSLAAGAAAAEPVAPPLGENVAERMERRDTDWSLAALMPVLAAAPLPAFSFLPPTATGAVRPTGSRSFDFNPTVEPAIAARFPTALPSRDESTGSIPSQPARRDMSLFESVPLPFGKLPALAQMAAAERDIAAGVFEGCATTRCNRARLRIETAMSKLGSSDTPALAETINRLVNTVIRYRTDSAIYGTIDHWAGPSETLNRGVGDCEDFAILKLALLADAGIDRSDMSIVILRDQRREVYHAVLALRTGARTLILDNVRSQVLDHDQIADYLPLYSLTDGKGHIYGRRAGSGPLMASLGRLDAIAPGEGGGIAAHVALEGPIFAAPRIGPR